MAQEDKANENDETVVNDDEDESLKPGNFKKTLLKIILIIVLSSASITGGLFASLGGDGFVELFSGEENPSNTSKVDESKKRDSYRSKSGEFKILNMNEMVLNITGQTSIGGKTSRFLKVKVSIVYESSEELDKRMSTRQAFIRDSFQDYLRHLDEKELIGTLGLLNLKSELLKRVKIILESENIKEILISDLIIQ